VTLCEIKNTAHSLHITVMFRRIVLTYLMTIYKALVKFIITFEMYFLYSF
jgi:hypothetical protein